MTSAITALTRKKYFNKQGHEFSSATNLNGIYRHQDNATLLTQSKAFT